MKKSSHFIHDESGSFSDAFKAFADATPKGSVTESYRMDILTFGTGGDEKKKKCKSRSEGFTSRFRDIVDKEDTKSIKGNSD